MSDLYSIVSPTCDVCGNLVPCECRECTGCHRVTADPVYLDGDSYCADCAVQIATAHELPVWVRAAYGVWLTEEVEA